MRFFWNFSFCFASSTALISPLSTPSTKRIPDNVKLLILPGFGNDSGDYFLPQAPQGSLVRSLRNRGWREDQIQVLPVERSDWLQVFLNGIVDIKFWLGNMPAFRPSFGWYLQKIANEIENEDNVVLVCHSAGGWLARAAIGYGSSSTNNNNNNECEIQVDLDKVLGLVTLGSPHLPPPPEVMDMTRGALRITNEDFPEAYHKEDIFYLTVIGKALTGVKQERQSPFERSTPTGVAFNSYDAVCGNGTTIGDGLVPIDSAHLQNARQLDLDGVFHSIGTPDTWYGSDIVLDRWHTAMLEEIEKRQSSNKPSLASMFMQSFGKETV